MDAAGHGNRRVGVTVDCLDVERVAAFRSAFRDRPRGPSMPGWVCLGHVDDSPPRLVFQPAPEPRRGKVRLHLNIAVDDLTTAIAHVLALALGGGMTGERHEYEERVVAIMADPEGHEVCLSQFSCRPAEDR